MTRSIFLQILTTGDPYLIQNMERLLRCQNPILIFYHSVLYAIYWGTGQCMVTSSNGNIFLVTGLCEGNSPVTVELSTQRTSDAKNVSNWWRHHGYTGNNSALPAYIHGAILVIRSVVNALTARIKKRTVSGKNTRAFCKELAFSVPLQQKTTFCHFYKVPVSESHKCGRS